MSNEYKDWLEDRAHQYIKADKLREWISKHYPNYDYSYMESLPDYDDFCRAARKLDSFLEEILNHLSDFVDENIEYKGETK